jgi:hypothetical protein
MNDLFHHQELPSQISSEEERELLALMCRVHELEVEKMALQSERLIKQHELWRRDLIILRYDRQRHLCEEIITRQRQLMEGKLACAAMQESTCLTCCTFIYLGREFYQH